MPDPRLKLLLVGANVDGGDVGGVFSAFKWAEALSRKADVTLLSFHRQGREPLADQLPEAEVVTWLEPPFLVKRERFNAMVKPGWPLFCRHVRRWIAAARRDGRRFDVAHQIAPQAMRYATPLRGQGIPYVIGPLDGGLSTPPGFREEAGRDGGFSALRGLDDLRLAHDPWLRRGYAEAALVLGVAPYVRTALASIPLRRFELALERANDGLAAKVARQTAPGRLSLLHVGRSVRTKALRDVIRALARLGDLPGVTLTSAGDGPELAACRAEAEALGVADRVTFLGAVPRDEVERLYEAADVFCFPSFREPMGGVLFEAMRWGLPVIAAGRGGPDAIIDETCGIKVTAEQPEPFARDIAQAIRALAEDPDLRARLGQGARDRLAGFGDWPTKADRMIALYREILPA